MNYKNMSSIEELKSYQQFYNIMYDKLNTDLHKQMIIGKSRRQGYSNMNKAYEDYMNQFDSLYNLRTTCKNLYKELIRYNMVGYKQTFTSEEDDNINKMMESKDQYTLELARQIILTKLNE